MNLFTHAHIKMPFRKPKSVWVYFLAVHDVSADDLLPLFCLFSFWGWPEVRTHCRGTIFWYLWCGDRLRHISEEKSIWAKTLSRCYDSVLLISGAYVCMHTHPQRRNQELGSQTMALLLHATSFRNEWTYVCHIFMRLHDAVWCTDNTILWLCLRRVANELVNPSQVTYSHTVACGMKSWYPEAKGKSWTEVKN